MVWCCLLLVVCILFDICWLLLYGKGGMWREKFCYEFFFFGFVWWWYFLRVIIFWRYMRWRILSLFCIWRLMFGNWGWVRYIVLRFWGYEREFGVIYRVVCFFRVVFVRNNRKWVGSFVWEKLLVRYMLMFWVGSYLCVVV